MKISVIIPVYNAEKYLRRAVESALQQSECGEVVLVEDKSPDNALEVCRELSKKYENVHFYLHENNQNLGPGPSRNLGVIKSKYDHIAFLDADDVYLPGRFEKSAKLLMQNPDIDGIYEPVGSTFENEEAQRRYFESHSGEIAMVTKDVTPEDLFECLISGQYGYIHPNGLSLKKDAFVKVGMYPKLRLHEDTVLSLKLALSCKMVPGEIKSPVSTRLLHMENTITKPGIDFLKTRNISFENMLQWMKENNINKIKQRLLKKKYLHYKYRLRRREKKIFSAIVLYIHLKILKQYISSYDVK